MSTPLLTFQKFNDPGLATTICEQLQNHGIQCEVVKESASFDPSYAFNDFRSDIHLKLPGEDFPKAHQVLETFYQQQLASIDKDYYLFSFTNEELLDIVRHPDEWGHLDLALAKKLLADRGEHITPQQEENFREKRITQLSQGDTVKPVWIAAIYFVSISGFLGATFIGLIAGFYGSMATGLIGAAFAFIKKALPNGEQVYLYTATTRKHGKRILIIAVIAFAFWVYKFIGL